MPNSAARGGGAGPGRAPGRGPAPPPRAAEFGIFFSKITPKLQNKGPKKGKIGLPKSPAKTRLGGARSAPPNLVLLMRAFWEAYFSFFGALILQFLLNF